MGILDEAKFLFNNFQPNGQMETGEKETKPRYGTVNFERRKYLRFNVDLPIEYARSDLVVEHGRVINVSEGGLLIYFPELMEIG